MRGIKYPLTVFGNKIEGWAVSEGLEQLDQMAGVERSVFVCGVKVIVREVDMVNLKMFNRACAPFLNEFDEAGALSDRGKDGETKPIETFALFRVLSEHSDEFMDAALLVTNVSDRVFFERMKPDQFFEIASLIIQVNGDFFIQRLAPKLIQMAQGISMIGTMLSSDLSPMAMEQFMKSSSSPTGYSPELFEPLTATS